VVPAEAVTAPGSRLAGHVDRKHDRECGKRDECQFFRMRNPFHGIFTFSFYLWDATALPKIHPPTVLIWECVMIPVSERLGLVGDTYTAHPGFRP